jgi:Raf kinase inhibitor-like YbhB/YbcL family protein
MLEKLPAAIGRVLRNTRPGLHELLFNDDDMSTAAEDIRVTSPAFGDGEPIPVRYTADGDKLSPPLAWSGIPDDTEALVLLIEDADSPTPEPLVHAIVWDLPPSDAELPEGALPSNGDHPEGMGRNSFLRRAYLPPDPPPGHGPHRYAFQLFACDCALLFEGAPGRGKLIETLEGHVIAKGCLIGIYERI